MKQKRRTSLIKFLNRKRGRAMKVRRQNVSLKVREKKCFGLFRLSSNRRCGRGEKRIAILPRSKRETEWRPELLSENGKEKTTTMTMTNKTRGRKTTKRRGRQRDEVDRVSSVGGPVAVSRHCRLGGVNRNPVPLFFLRTSLVGGDPSGGRRRRKEDNRLFRLGNYSTIQLFTSS